MRQAVKGSFLLWSSLGPSTPHPCVVKGQWLPSTLSLSLSILSRPRKTPNCKEPILKIGTNISRKEKPRPHVPMATFMYKWAIYIFPRSICLFCCRKYVDRSWEYINCLQTCLNVEMGLSPRIPRKGINKGDFRCSAVPSRDVTNPTLPGLVSDILAVDGRENRLPF